MLYCVTVCHAPTPCAIIPRISSCNLSAGHGSGLTGSLRQSAPAEWARSSRHATPASNPVWPSKSCRPSLRTIRSSVYDIQPELLAVLKEKAAAERLTNIIPLLGEEADPKLPDAKFDWILLVDVYHELQKPEPMLAAFRKALKPSGRVALVEYRETTSHISPAHRMTKAEVLREWIPAGFRLVEIIETMPMQRLYIFSVEPGRSMAAGVARMSLTRSDWLCAPAF